MSNILVTGGTGFVGSHLVDRLVEQNHNVYVIDDLSNSHLTNLKQVEKKVRFVRHDVSNPFSFMFNSLLPSNIDAIYHLACYPRSRSFENPQRDVEVNVIGTINTLELARKTNAKIFFSSNSGIYDTSKIPIDENTVDKPTAPYDLDKLHAENYMKLYHEAYGLQYVIFRFATIYGPRQNISEEWKPVVMEFISKLQQKKAPTIYWSGEQTRDFIYVSDIVSALVSVLDSEDAVGETMILASNIETSINTLYKTVSNLLNVSIEPLRGPKQLGDVARMRYNCEKARKILGWQPKVGLKEGIKRVIIGETKT